MIMAGEADIVVAGGMENMSMAPYAMTKARFGYRMNNATIIDTMVNDALTDAFNHYHMMITAENVCDKYGITREELDEFSANSQQKCEAAIAAGKFDDEIVPVPVKVKKEMVDFKKDEGPRAGTTAESLSKLRCCSGKEVYRSCKRLKVRYEQGKRKRWCNCTWTSGRSFWMPYPCYTAS